MTQPVSLKHRARRQFHAPKIERQPTAMGKAYRILRFFGMVAIGRWLFRKPRHVADLYVNGHFVRALYITWNGTRP